MEGMAQTSTVLDTIQVTAGTMTFGQSIGYFAYGVPNFTPGTYFGDITRARALEVGLAPRKLLEDVLDKSGAESSLGYIKTFTTMDNMMLDRGWSAEQTWFNSQLLAGQHAFVYNTAGVTFSGGAFTPFRALYQNLFGKGEDAHVNINNIGLDVSALEIPALRKLIKEKFDQPGTYSFDDPKFGYSTEKDSLSTGAYLGGIVLKAHGSLIINEDKTYSFTAYVSSERPDYYDADPKPDGARSFAGEASTTILRALGGTSYFIHIDGEKAFSGQGYLDENGSFTESLLGNSYDNLLRTGKPYQPLAGGPGNDTYVIYASDTSINEAPSEGIDRVISTVNYNLPDNTEFLYLAGDAISGKGNNLDNYIRGNHLDNYLTGAGGNDFIDGGDGIDTAFYTNDGFDFAYVSSHGQTAVVTTSEGKDSLFKIEKINVETHNYNIRDNVLQWVASYGDLIDAFGSHTAAQTVLDNFKNNNSPTDHRLTFDGAEYLVTNRDVFQAFGFDPEKAAEHYIDSGRYEGRTVSSFDSLAYIASYKDLMDAFGIDRVKGSEHFLINGEGERRSVQFDPQAYMKKYADIAAYAHNDPDMATIHYITAGYAEGRDWHI